MGFALSNRCPGRSPRRLPRRVSPSGDRSIAFSATPGRELLFNLAILLIKLEKNAAP